MNAQNLIIFTYFVTSLYCQHANEECVFFSYSTLGGYLMLLLFDNPMHNNFQYYLITLN